MIENISFEKKIKFSNGFTGSAPISVSEINKFDIIHLHWINNGFFNLEKINNINVPIVWTIRDMWPFTGGCHYTLGCKKFYSECKLCPSINNLFFKDDSILNLFNKNSIFKNQNIHLVGISKWIENEIKTVYFKNNKIHQIIIVLTMIYFFQKN